MKQKLKDQVKFDRFKHFSEEAASLERKGDYKNASNAWSDASRNATNEINKKWCNNRADFCDRVAKKPF
ncbi:hypothetical protein BMT54_01250 [Pasteurellaceae bacterium 15-036681]|nr:hypothetical protein BMT54_01250 [Pasteurellaceae bacterium 15-036681]